MKKVLLLSFALFCAVCSFAQGIIFEEGSFADALKRAKSEKKLIFVDIYTTWCGPCKMMSDEIFPRTTVGSFYNDKFINMKLDAENSADGKMIAEKYKVSSYPTMLFINGDGEQVFSIIGARDEAQFLKEGENAVKAIKALPKVKQMDKIHEKGGSKANKAFYKKYYKARKEIGLDCSDAVISYYSLLRDDEIALQENIMMIMDIKRYDQEVTSKIMRSLVMSSGSMHPQMFAQYNMVCAGILSNSINESMNEKGDDHTKFQHLMTLRDAFITIKGNEPKVVYAMRAGIVLMPTELIYLQYFKTRGMNKEFSDQFSSYMTQYIQKSRGVMGEVAKIVKQAEESVKAAQASNNQQEAQRISHELGIFINEIGTEVQHTTGTLLDYISYYISITDKEKDAAFDKSIMTWCLELVNIFPSYRMAHTAADILISRDKSPLALQILKKGLEKGASTPGSTEQDFNRVNELIAELEAK